MRARRHAIESSTHVDVHPARRIDSAGVVVTALVGLGLVLRLWLAQATTLTKDEAAYWVWAGDLEPGYAWIPFASIRAACALFGDHEWSVRLPFLLASTGAAVCFHGYALALGLGPWGAATALALFSANTWFHFAGATAHPDAFLALFWIGSLWALERSGTHRGSRGGLWLLVGSGLAAAAALSKYTGFALWPAWLLTRFLPGSRPRARWIAAASALWLLIVAPALLAVAAEGAQRLRMALGLSFLGDRLPVTACFALVPFSPFLALLSPGFAVYLLGVAAAVGRAAAARRGVFGILVSGPVFAAAARGSVKGNWILPALWGTLPDGAACLARSRGGRRILGVAVAAGAAGLVVAHIAVLHPETASAAARRVRFLGALDRSYASTVSREEWLHSSARTWSDRAREFHGAPSVVDSIAARAASRSASRIVTNLYEIAYQTRFYDPGMSALLVDDARFSGRAAYVASADSLQGTALYVTLPGARLPNILVAAYRDLEREPRLVVPMGGGGSRTYDVWRCRTAGAPMEGAASQEGASDAEAYDPAANRLQPVLSRFVAAEGVDYDGLARDSADCPSPRGSIRCFLDEAAAAGPHAGGGSPRDREIAFYINVYNAATLDLILTERARRRTPLRSIQEIPGAWGRPTWLVDGKRRTLDEIEHQVLRKRYREPRIHFALVCASRSCPSLRRTAYRGDSLDAQLDAAAREFLLDSTRNEFTPRNGRIRISKIFDWYGKDFVGVYGDEELERLYGPSLGASLACAVRFLPEEIVSALRRSRQRIEFLPYDWALNAREPR